MSAHSTIGVLAPAVSYAADHCRINLYRGDYAECWCSVIVTRDWLERSLRAVDHAAEKDMADTDELDALDLPGPPPPPADRPPS